MSNTKSVSVVAVTVLSLGLNACGGFENKKKGASRPAGLANSRMLPMPPDVMAQQQLQLQQQQPQTGNLPGPIGGASPRPEVRENAVVREPVIERFDPSDSGGQNTQDTRVSEIVVERSSQPAVPKGAAGKAPLLKSSEAQPKDAPAAAATPKAEKAGDPKSQPLNAAKVKDPQVKKEEATELKKQEQPEANACTTTFLKDNRDWAPGIPYEPTKEPHYTYGSEKLAGASSKSAQKKNTQGLNYTDAGVDGLMNVAILSTEKLPDAIKAQSKQMAIRIDDVKVFIDEKQGLAKMHFGFEEQRGHRTEVQLAGQIQGAAQNGRLDVELSQVAGGRVQPAAFTAHLTCADAEIGCQTVMIRLQRAGQDGRALGVAYILHRWGPVLVTMPERDRKVSKNIQNTVHKDFASFLSVTAQNSCLALIDGFAKGQRNVPACALERMVHDCGGKKVEASQAQDFIVRTWSVAFGKAGFEWLALKQSPRNTIDYDNKKDVVLSVSGPLAVSQQRPMVPSALVVAPADGPGQAIRTARLVMNDGGGNLNLQLLFKGKGKSQTRVTLTSLFEDTRFRERIARELENMPEAAQKPAKDGR